MSLILYIKCSNDAIKKYYEAEQKKRQSPAWVNNPHKDSGVDIYCPADITLESGNSTKLHLGIFCALYKNHIPDQKGGRPKPFFLVPRSSISKTPLRMSNNIGIIDSGYRGPIMGAVDNIKMVDYRVEKGQRLFQIVAPDLGPMEIDLVDVLSETLRGEGGFGSTGD